MSNAERRQRTTRDEIVEILREMPDLTVAEIQQLMTHVTTNAVSCAITALKAEGIVRVSSRREIQRANGRPFYVNVHALNDNPTPNVIPMKRSKPTEVALQVRLDEANALVAELKAWKEAAIARYPDLAVEPVVLRARKLVAQELRDAGDHALAEQVDAGRKDTTLMMRVAIKALEEIND